MMQNDVLSGEIQGQASQVSGGTARTGRLAVRAASAAALAARISLGAMVFLAPLRFRLLLAARPAPPVFRDYTDFLLFAADPFLAAALLFWLVSLVLEPRPVSLKPLGMTIGVAGLFLASLVSAFFSVDRSLSLFHALHLVLLFGLYLFVLNEIKNLVWVTLPAGLMLAVQALIAITQVLRQHSLGLASLQELSLDPVWKGVSIVWTPAASTLRAYGLSDHPNILGGCLAVGLVLLAAWYLEMPAHWRPLGAAVFGLGLVGLLLTFSRSAFLGLGISLLAGAAWLLVAKKKRELTHWVILGTSSLVFLAPFLIQNAAFLGTRFNYDNSFTNPTPENQSINERALLAGLAKALLSAHPLVGVGIGAFPEALFQANPNYAFNFQPPHIVLLDVAAETGLPGAFFYLLVELFPWAYLLLRRKEIRLTPSLLGVYGLLLAISTISLFDYYPWMIESGRLLQWLTWGLFSGFISGAKENCPVDAQ
jgi:O-antigen ligase